MGGTDPAVAGHMSDDKTDTIQHTQQHTVTCYCDIRLNSYNPGWDVFWNLVGEEIPVRLSRWCRACYMSDVFLTQLTCVFLRTSVGRVRCAPACVSTDSRSKTYTPPPSPRPLS